MTVVWFTRRTYEYEYSGCAICGGGEINAQTWLVQQWIVLEVDLPNRHVICRLPVTLDPVEQVNRKWSIRG
jgi:hypothetical protein